MPIRLEPTMTSSVSAIPKTSCSVCGSGQLEKVLNLPDLPLTGIYVQAPCPGRYPNFDQALLLCEVCGHAQLLYAIDPDYLYVDTYSHRSSASAIATQGNDHFEGFLERVAGGRKFNSVVEVGCNDLYLFGKLRSAFGRFFGIDPIWKDKRPPDEPKISVIGKFIEEVDLEKEIVIQPDLVISAHTFEHLRDPKSSLEAIMHFAAPGALFVIEVPCFDSLLRTLRFDQVFHQHIQYFSLASLVRLVRAIGGRYLTHCFNTDYWEGTLLMAFRKPGGAFAEETVPEAPFSAPNATEVRRRFQTFQVRMKAFWEMILRFKKPLYGYGAAQMLPTFAYHLKSDLGLLECVLDDDPDKDGRAYPDLKPCIQKTDPELDLANAGVLITALDSSSVILKKLSRLRIGKIFDPSGFLKDI